MIELLAPAGNMEKLKTAIYYGADACYFAGKQFGMRAMSGNFSDEELREAVQYAHALGKKCYITVNILAHNADFTGLKEYLEYLQEIGVDAVIVSDFGIMACVKEYAPGLDIHVSTQSNITNKYSAMEYVRMGAKRLVLARELSIEEIKEIREYIPKDIEIECFVHGAMCISYSGRCLLSNYLCGRDSNRGACVQACRFEYTIREKSRVNGNDYEIQEDDRGTYILNSKDMCLIRHIKELVDAGITSFKIEGRMKSPYYVATVINAYRRAIDMYQSSPDEFVCPEYLYEECEKTSHRRFTTGFYFHEKDKEFLETSMPIQSHEFMAIVVSDQVGDWVEIEQRNRFKVGDVLEILSPSDNFNKVITVTAMTDVDGVEVVDALKVQQRLRLNVSGIDGLKTGDILRKKI
ncbi:MAG: U32 family peptidase [Clostridiales bacterium]|nr:U32 family peptidase [Clostridiales bacterium]